MSVESREITCYEYINAMRDIIKWAGQGLYGLDNRRTLLHEKLCEEFDLSKCDTLKFTNNLDLDDYKCAENLYINLLEKSRSLKEE